MRAIAYTMETIWRELTVITSLDAADSVANRLMEFGAHGTISEDLPDKPTHCQVIAYYPDTPEVDLLIEELRTYLRELQALDLTPDQGEIVSKRVPEIDWQSQWKQHFKPTRIGNRLVIKPSWESWQPQPDDIVIELDPGMAFGTGLHASTRLALRFLERYLHPGDAVLDVGVGSGILSIAAARLGATYVFGFDVDADAAAIAQENVRRNATAFPQDPPLDAIIEVQTGSIDTLEILRKFDCIVMNIRPNIILPLVPYALTYLQTGGALILSGILEEEGSEFLDHLRPCDLIVQNYDTEAGWIAYVCSQLHWE
ncbi:methyltransferase domain-containing protein [candidate division KSB3 bacterium]|uniref:Ribosomal protein L11 methyltransferase n=1 Tax=candidate division KSB3 bacterium TaxID=2044937 RepID=A0A9D5JYX9_9BACT|nr:methyltransferase domain-containing protein [candidate division KSB3 bacterium]MBD3326585.1 methyltransferase domain-containing protein [candidate division KSB3 bacterium]